MESINLPIHLKEPLKVLRNNLKILSNGLMICKIKIINPNNLMEITCNALIDTGAEVSLICKSLFDKLSFNEKDKLQGGTSTLDSDEMVFACNVNMALPYNNWSKFSIGVYIKDFSKRQEYQAIIGMNIIVNYQLVYKGIENVAWLEEL